VREQAQRNEEGNAPSGDRSRRVREDAGCHREIAEVPESDLYAPGCCRRLVDRQDLRADAKGELGDACHQD
jgi:hypothetical protein